MALHLNENDFEEKVLKEEKAVLVDFYADWCGPCKMMAPIVEELAAKYEGKAVVAKINIDDNMLIAQKYRVMSIPTFIVFKNGEAVETLIGGTSKENLEKMIEKHM